MDTPHVRLVNARTCGRAGACAGLAREKRHVASPFDWLRAQSELVGRRPYTPEQS